MVFKALGSLKPRENYLIKGSQDCSCSLGTTIFSFIYYIIQNFLFLLSHCFNTFHWTHFTSPCSKQ